MRLDDFKSIEEMSQQMKGKIVGIRKMQWFHFEKSSPFFKDTLNEGMPFNSICLKKNPGRPPVVELQPLYNSPVKIKVKKYKNLLELLPFVPPIHHYFYKGLPYQANDKTNSNNHNEREEDGGEDDKILESDESAE